MKHTTKSTFFIFACIFFFVMTLLPYSIIFAADVKQENYADVPSIPTLDTEGTVLGVSEAEKENLMRLFSAANPSDLLISFDFEDNIDHTMWVAGFAAGCNSDEAGSDSDLFEMDLYFGADAEAHFAGLWAEYFDGWNLLDEAIPPTDILPFSIDGSVKDSMYYRIENDFMQSLIKGIYGREMVAPEKHIRYYDEYFYFGHIGDIEERLWYGYDYTIDNVYDLLNEYYRIEGKATYFDYATGELEDRKVYEALVKKDMAAEHTYFLIAQRFNEYEDME